MGKSQQQKGRRAERELAAILQGHGYDVRPGAPCNHGTTPDLTGLPGIHIEAKRREKLDLYGALRQSAADADKFSEGVPVVMHRANRCPWVVSMTLDSFLALYEQTKPDKSG